MKAFLFSIFALSSLHPHPHAITNGMEPFRRLGDNITTVTKTKYFARKYNLPYYFTSFTYADSFALPQKEIELTDSKRKEFSKFMVVSSEQDIENNLENEEPILFVAVFLSFTPWIYAYSRENPEFEHEIKRIFKPSISIRPLAQEEGKVKVALHVRKGGGVDWPLGSIQEFNVDQPLLKENELYLYCNNPAISCTSIWPLRCLPGPAFITETKNLFFKKNYYADYIWSIKFPPDQYYIEQVKTLASFLPDKHLQIQIFTDDPVPEQIVSRYAQALQALPNLSFYYRTTENNHDKNVIEDLFAIAQSDCLISASSSFAFAAMLLGNHSVIIFPEHAITLPDRVIIDKVHIVKVENPHSPKRSVRSEIYSITKPLL